MSVLVTKSKTYQQDFLTNAFFILKRFFNEYVTTHTRVRPVLAKNMYILASFVNKWISFKKMFTFLERLPQRQHFWLNKILSA